MVVAEGEKRSSFPGVVVGEAGGANASQQDPPPSAKGIMPVPAGHHCAHKAQTREDLPHDDVGPTRGASEPTGGQQHGRGDGGAHAPILLFSAGSAQGFPWDSEISGH